MPWLHGCWVALALICSLIWLRPSRVSAEGALELVLVPGITCLQQTSLSLSLSALLTNTQQAVDLTVRVDGSTLDPRTAVITLHKDEQAVAQRTFSPGPPRCSDFHNAVALAISMMIKSLEQTPAPPLVTEREPAQPREAAPTSPQPAPRAHGLPPAPPAPPPPVTSRPVQIVSRLPRTRPTARSPLVLSAQLSGVLARHVGAKTAWGTRLELVMARSRYGVRLGLLGLFARADRLAETQVDYVTRPLAASLTGCVGAAPEARFGLRGCLGLLAGQIRSRGVAAEQVEAREKSLPWVALVLALELSARLHEQLRLVLSITPVYSTRELRVGAQAADNPSEALPRLGALFTVGVAYDFYHQGSPGFGHE